MTVSDVDLLTEQLTALEKRQAAIEEKLDKVLMVLVANPDSSYCSIEERLEQLSRDIKELPRLEVRSSWPY